MTGTVGNSFQPRCYLTARPETLSRYFPEKLPMNRDHAYALLTEYVQDLGLRRHMLGVEAAMRAYACKLGQDEETWGVVGLLHDFDYERWPDPPDHPLKGSEILRQHGYPEEV